MSQETLQWLNQNTLIGFTSKRGNAWHFKASEQGDEVNHYVGEIPIEDVRRRLFPWEAIEGQLTATALLDDGVLSTTDPERKAIMRSDTGAILGIFKSGYQIHQYEEWLLDSVATLLDDDLSIGSAGLLKNGGVAWVSVEVPDNIITPEGVEFRPHLIAATSHDGSLSTTFKRSVTNVVCDNTLAAGLSNAGGRVKVKHSRYSSLKLSDARDALAIIHTVADEFSTQVAQLCNTPVSDDQWVKFNDLLIPVPEQDGAGKTLATNKQAALSQLWNNDIRVTPWKNTSFGVLQAVNTADHHVWNVRGDRAQRNMLRTVTGAFDTLDANTLDVLATVLS